MIRLQCRTLKLLSWVTIMESYSCSTKYDSTKNRIGAPASGHRPDIMYM